MSTTLGAITKHAGIAGQIAYSVTATYEDEAPQRIEFIGNTYGGPIVMVTPTNLGGTFVSDPDRFGPFGPEWVRKFFA